MVLDSDDAPLRGSTKRSTTSSPPREFRRCPGPAATCTPILYDADEAEEGDAEEASRCGAFRAPGPGLGTSRYEEDEDARDSLIVRCGCCP
jgi:hypothetical protein